MRRSLTAAATLALLAALAGCQDGSPNARQGSPSGPPTGTAGPPATGAPTASASPSPGATAAALAPPPPGATVVGVLGDFGVDAPPVRRVVAAMDRFAGAADLAAIVTTGDNAYQRGTRSQAAFARRVLAPIVGRRTRLLASLGNHDIGTAGGAHVMREFGMPARWYAAVVGPVQFVILDANQPGDAEQLAFLDRTLAAARPTPFRVVAYHQPAMSCSFHRPNEAVVRHWVPRFAGRVDLVLSGHNHTYERFATDRGPAYVTTGGGGAGLYPSYRAGCGGPGRVVSYRTVHHAVRLVATREVLRLEAVATDGSVFDRLRLTAGAR